MQYSGTSGSHGPLASERPKADNNMQNNKRDIAYAAAPPPAITWKHSKPHLFSDHFRYDSQENLLLIKP